MAEISFSATRTASVQTPLTCNCLLPACLTGSSSALKCAASDSDVALGSLLFHAASYELLPPSAPPQAEAEEEDVEKDAAHHSHDACHVGECSTYEYRNPTGSDAPAVAQRCTTTFANGVPALPGVFDLTAAPTRFLASAAPAASAAGDLCLVLACTDGSVRAVDPATLTGVADAFTDIHAEMITSCTPLYAPSRGGCATPHLLCSAHTGAVLLYSLQERAVTQELEGHDFDAWCTAAVPMGGWWTAAPPAASVSSGSDDEKGEGEDGVGGCAGDGGLSTASLLASGGDDGWCKLYDVRCNGTRAIGRMRFDAGVVSITPVLDTSAGASAAHSTPYVLVGSYDESIALMDVRFPRRPVAQRAGLGGGVWRTSRCLCPLFGATASPSSSALSASVREGDRGEKNATLQLMLDTAQLCGGTGGLGVSCGWVNTSNVLVLPLMQRGAALLPYDVHASSDAVFDSSPLTYLYADAEELETEKGARPASLPALTEKSLVYDTAVLRPLRCGADAPAVVATASFYEKRIDLWTVTAGERH